ncbi:MAG: protein-L-isoaspartate(D-aspartate) O-methyltransferase [Pelotomaculum sp.]|uniref:Protein-L-isoaspartate O-methyltransferase n=1 Tax=Pelotomaculum thermopropionicum (strain DSM 13744 / JCM 10971 / SI) TaxID=370438 RepID=PIMT_PELTS|nr:RecName: Full=Protein-L-isoaspartate O-methyltransferase; AltName: Full=L-isoaspartyl protein carboxyl methyltransferase; AltName: Full=Protein L-isoaspartyl methyltransferase; AltName: Full=Protein-beta-aspartate methyltransferase; Short=PIMT [Pelotomaculum thermopropionicum SI]NPV73090.1 protein-L-isoaspartate(D-aspartate) O-methyltransferase [Pelotomaculum sp.]BAF60859.1 protein-L-isoaspartate carboxylmethyltransferase [Pelotomaculum thermopropionicum SI]
MLLKRAAGKEKDDDNRAGERRRMVYEQLISRGIENDDVIQSMLEVPRHRFVPKHLQEYAYQDGPLAIGEGQTISQPYIVALMIEALEPAPSDRVLEVGTGSGYAAAVLSRIVSVVYTIERFDSLARGARSLFQSLKYDNIYVRTGDGTKGWPEAAPFDGIIVSAGAPAVPQTLCGQLKPGGRLVAPVGDKRWQELLVVRRALDGGYNVKKLGTVFFVPLVGEEGWHDET